MIPHPILSKNHTYLLIMLFETVDTVCYLMYYSLGYFLALTLIDIKQTVSMKYETSVKTDNVWYDGLHENIPEEWVCKR